MAPLRLLPALAWAAVIFTLSSLSSPPGAPGSEPASLAAHALSFGLLAILLAWYVESSPRLRASVGRSWLLAAVWLVTVLYGASDEFHQSFVPGRHPDVIDLAADAIGAASALAVWSIARCKYREARSTRRETVSTSAEHR